MFLDVTAGLHIYTSHNLRQLNKHISSAMVEASEEFQVASWLVADFGAICYVGEIQCGPHSGSVRVKFIHLMIVGVMLIIINDVFQLPRSTSIWRTLQRQETMQFQTKHSYKSIPAITIMSLLIWRFRILDFAESTQVVFITADGKNLAMLDNKKVPYSTHVSRYYTKLSELPNDAWGDGEGNHKRKNV